MKVQRIKLGENQYSWIVLDEQMMSIEPIEKFIAYLIFTEKSPDTVKSYATHLKLFWQYLSESKKNWLNIDIGDIASFVHWLRSDKSKIISIENPTKRKESTINAILSAISSLYRYHNQLGNTNIQFLETCYLPHNKYKSLLYHIHKHKSKQKRIVSLKQSKSIPKILTTDRVERLLRACANYRDTFLISLLYETGMRIGEALSLKHEDIKSWDNEIYIIPRKDGENGVRSKATKPNVIHVSKSLMRLYSDYVLSTITDNDCPYVFINLVSGKPLTYISARKIFMRLQKKTGIDATPHMLRHTHATDLIKSGWDPALVQKRLGHQSIQTTLNIYAHLDNDDLKKAFLDYQKQKGDQ